MLLQMYFFTEPQVRLCVYECILEAGEPLEVHIAQSEMLPLLFDSLTDQSYLIRESIVCILGRIGHLNPAFVMPALRKLVIQVRAEMRGKNESFFRAFLN